MSHVAGKDKTLHNSAVGLWPTGPAVFKPRRWRPQRRRNDTCGPSNDTMQSRLAAARHLRHRLETPHALRPVPCDASRELHSTADVLAARLAALWRAGHATVLNDRVPLAVRASGVISTWAETNAVFAIACGALCAHFAAAGSC